MKESQPCLGDSVKEVNLVDTKRRKEKNQPAERRLA